jgi:hypothetical protein
LVEEDAGKPYLFFNVRGVVMTISSSEAGRKLAESRKVRQKNMLYVTSHLQPRAGANIAAMPVGNGQSTCAIKLRRSSYDYPMPV